jgi:tetratricopeptide (TPR) repeat protein
MLRVYTARVAYLSGRSWNDHGDKKNAIRWFEEAVGSAQDLIKMEGETPVALLCLADPLAELCLLKDLGFLMTNGPKIGRYADKVLAIDPSNVKALLLKASALAYPPPIWGGNYKKALTMYADILAEASSGLPPDLLFDVRAGIATAYANLRLKDHALWWFRAALELYPTNPYATRMIKDLTR